MPRYIDIEPIEMAAKDRGYRTVSLPLINEQPTADVRENVHAHWVYEALEGFPEITFPVCSNCDEDGIDYVESNFCPHCGAVMDESIDDD